MCKHFTVVFVYIIIVYWITWLAQHPKVLIVMTATVAYTVALVSTVYLVLMCKAAFEAWREGETQ